MQKYPPIEQGIWMPVDISKMLFVSTVYFIVLCLIRMRIGWLYVEVQEHKSPKVTRSRELTGAEE